MTTEHDAEAGCLCGAVRLGLPGEPLWAAWCHCADCRRATGAPASAWIGYRHRQVRWLGERAAEYRSSPHVTRGFCARCGSTLTYHDDRLDEEIYLAAGVLDDPAAAAPQAHAWDHTRLPWVRLDDGLPRVAGYSRPRPPASRPTEKP